MFVGGLYASSRPASHRRPNPVAAQVKAAVHPMATTPTVGTPSTTPSLITVNTPTTVTVTAQISPTPITNGVNLLRVGATGTQPTILGVMHDDGLNGDAVANDGIYTLQIRFNEAVVGQIQLQVSAAFKGLLTRSLSSQGTVLIWNKLADQQTGITLAYPPGLLPQSSVDGQGTPYILLSSSSMPLLIGSGALPTGTTESDFAQTGYEITVSKYSYPTTAFDIQKWLTDEASAEQVSSLAPYNIGPLPAYIIVFTGEADSGEPVIIVPHNNTIYTVSYDSTFDIGSVDDNNGLVIFYNVVQSMLFP
jgi:hypothetical protein